MKAFTILSRNKPGEKHADTKVSDSEDVPYTAQQADRSSPEKTTDDRKTTRQLRIIDQGHSSSTLNKAATKMAQNLSTNHTLFVRRQGYSRRFLYHHCVFEVLKHNLAAIVAPNPIGISSQDFSLKERGVFLYDILDPAVCKEGTLYTIISKSGPSQLFIAEFLEDLYQNLDQLSERINRLLVVIDLFEIPLPHLENTIRKWMFSSYTNPEVTLWLHCSPLYFSDDLIGQYSNILAWLPTLQEVEHLQRVLPLSDFNSPEALQKLKANFFAFGPCTHNTDTDRFGQISTSYKIWPI